MCILFWYQYDGTTEKIKVSGPADTKSKPEEAAKPTTAGNNPENGTCIDGSQNLESSLMKATSDGISF